MAAVKANNDAAKAAAERSLAQVEQGIGELGEQYGNINKQLYRDYMESLRVLPQELAARGYSGGMSESARLGLDTAYGERLNENEAARIAAIMQLRQQGADAEYQANAARDQANAQAQQKYDNDFAQQQYQDKLRQQQFNNQVTSEKLNIAKGEWALKQSKAAQQAQKASAAAAQRAAAAGASGTSGPGSGNLNVGKSGVLGSTAVPYTAARLRSQGRSDAAIRTELLKEGYSSKEVGEIMKQLPEIQQAYIEGLAEGIRRALELVKTGAPKGEGAA